MTAPGQAEGESSAVLNERSNSYSQMGATFSPLQIIRLSLSNLLSSAAVERLFSTAGTLADPELQFRGATWRARSASL